MYVIQSEDKQLYDDGWLSIAGLMKAYKAQDPRLAEYAIKLCIIDPAPVSSEDTEEKKQSYADFRLAYHKDSIDPNVLEQVQPPFPRAKITRWYARRRQSFSQSALQS